MKCLEKKASKSKKKEKKTARMPDQTRATL